jgi:hypothetical protein
MVANPFPYQGTLCRLDLSTGSIAKYTSVVAKGGGADEALGGDRKPLSALTKLLGTTMPWMLLCIWFLGLSAMRLKNLAWLIHN